MKDLKEGLEIFLKYDPDAKCCAEHDVIYAWFSGVQNVMEEDKEKLRQLRWYWDPEAKTWKHFT